MASSQVEIASSSPFGCVLKDHNRRDRCRDTNARAAAFQKNLKDLVRDHLHNRITVSADEHHENPISHKQVDAWAAKQQGNNGNGNGHNRNLRFLSNNNNKGNGKNNRNDDDDVEENYGSSIMNSRQSRILDRWAAKQAREMVSTIEKQAQEAELLASSASDSSPLNCKKEHLQNSSAESGDTNGVGNLGASSLVQMWEKRLNRSNSLNNCMNLESPSSRTSSGFSNNDCEASRESEIGDSVDERDVARANNEDSLDVWRSRADKTAKSEPPTRRNSDAVESEKVKVADIIKRLTSAGDDTNDRETGTNQCESPSRERRRSPVADPAEQREQHGENRNFSRVVCSPKIRGRQAFADLLMQLERDRHRELELLGERRAVSRFPHRGRIQAMLRLRFLHRGMAIQDQQSSQSAGSKSFNRLSRRSAIKHLREIFSPGAEHGVTAQNDATTSGKNAEMENNTRRSEDSSTASRLSEGCHLQEATTAWRTSAVSKEINVLRASKDHQKEAIPKTDVKQKKMDMGVTSDDQKEASPKIDVKQKRIEMGTTSDQQKEAIPKTDVTQKGIDIETTFLDLEGTTETTSSLNGRSKRSEITEDCEVNQEQHIHGKLQEISQPTASLDDGQNTSETADEQEAGEQLLLCLDSQENAETIPSLNDWDENEMAEEEEAYFPDQFLETNYDWISEISRPRSYWEDRRRTWYQEMLHSNSEKEEIRQLLERGRVSTVLSGDFRETMDQLMNSRVERQTELEAFREEVQEMSHETIGQLLLAHLQRHMRSAASQEGEQAEERDQVQQVDEPIAVEEEEEEPEQQEEDGEQEEDEEEEEHNPMSPLFHEASDDFDNQSWSYQYHEVGDESDPVVSISSPQPLPSQASYQDGRQSSSSTTHLSIETELIYDLREQIKQLHSEMSELRKTVQTCMDMQVKVHQSNRQEVHPVKGVGNNSLDGVLKKRSCCICYEMQVDSLLYRCGHMCTCLKCAHELQWSSGKCPICRAPIDDVVRAFMDS